MRPSTPLNNFSETLGPIFFKVHMKPLWGLKVCTYGHGLKSKMGIMPIYGKNTKYSYPEPKKLWGWILVYSLGDPWTTKFVQMMTLGWHLVVLWQGQICVPMHLYWENIEKSFSENVWKTYSWNLQCMIIANPFSYNQNFVPWSCLPLLLGYIHV